MTRIASIKETGEEVSEADWQRFEEAVDVEKRHRRSLADVERSPPATRDARPDATDRAPQSQATPSLR